MGILGNIFIYALEIGKFYLVFRYFLGIEARKEKWRYGCAAILLIGFAVFLTYYEGNPIFEYLAFILAEMYLLFWEKLGKLAVISLWLASVIGVLDGVGKITIWIILDTARQESVFITAIDSCITMLFILAVTVVLKRKSRKDRIQIQLRYYVFFSILGIADSMMIGSIWDVFENMNGDNIFYIPILIGVVCMYIQMGMVLALAVSRDEYRKKDMMNKKYLEMQKEQYDYLKKKEADIRDFRHDMEDHMLSLRELCEEGNCDEIEDYVKKIMVQMHIEDNKAATGNGIVDAIINQYLFQAEQEKVKLKVIGKLLEDNKIEAYDYCIIFSNLLRNAIEAAKESGKKRVELLIQDTKERLLIRVWNDYTGERKMENGKYVTMKEDKVNHGIGMSNVRKSVEKYSGVMETVEKEEKFTVMISMQK